MKIKCVDDNLLFFIQSISKDKTEFNILVDVNYEFKQQIVMLIVKRDGKTEFKTPILTTDDYFYSNRNIVSTKNHLILPDTLTKNSPCRCKTCRFVLLLIILFVLLLFYCIFKKISYKGL